MKRKSWEKQLNNEENIHHYNIYERTRRNY